MTEHDEPRIDQPVLPPIPVYGEPTPGRPSWGRRIVVLAAVAALGLGSVALADHGDDEGPEPDREDEDALLDLEPVVLDLAGPRDGNESIGLPVQVDPSTGLTDGQLVTVTGGGLRARRVRGHRAVRGGNGRPARQCDRLVRHQPVHARDREQRWRGDRDLQRRSAPHHASHGHGRLPRRSRTLRRRHGRARGLRPLGRPPDPVRDGGARSRSHPGGRPPDRSRQPIGGAGRRRRRAPRGRRLRPGRSARRRPVLPRPGRLLAPRRARRRSRGSRPA